MDHIVAEHDVGDSPALVSASRADGLLAGREEFVEMQSRDVQGEYVSDDSAVTGQLGILDCMIAPLVQAGFLAAVILGSEVLVRPKEIAITEFPARCVRIGSFWLNRCSEERLSIFDKELVGVLMVDSLDVAEILVRSRCTTGLCGPIRVLANLLL